MRLYILIIITQPINSFEIYHILIQSLEAFETFDVDSNLYLDDFLCQEGEVYGPEHGDKSYEKTISYGIGL